MPVAVTAGNLRSHRGRRRVVVSAGTRPPLSPVPVLVAIVAAAVLLGVAGRYGYHRDELYFIVAGGHPAFGYPDQPPLVPLLLHAMHWLAPGSLLAIRLPSALAAAGTILVAALVARELNGRRAEQVIAAACTSVTAILLATGHFVTTTTFDMLSTTVVIWLVVRGLVRHSGGALLAAGIVTGIGGEAKPQVVLVYGTLLASVLLVGPRWPLRSRGLWLGALGGAALVLPYLLWQATHGWPQLTVATNIAGSAEGGRAGFVPFQLVLVSPFLLPVWVAGLVWAWRQARLRLLPLTYLLLAAAYLVGNGKAYYLASLYPALLAVGAIPVAGWLARGNHRTRVALLAAALALSAAINALIGLPVLPARDLNGSAPLALNPDLGETVGWPSLVSTVAGVWRQLPPASRAHTVIFTRNYGEAGAIDILGPARGLPAAYSGHNAFAEWGPPAADRTQVLLLGYDSPADAAPAFTACRQVARISNPDGVHNQEYGTPVLLCDRMQAPWTVLWPQLRHDN